MQEVQRPQMVTVENVNIHMSTMVGLVVRFWIASALAGPLICLIVGMSIMIFQFFFSINIGTK